ncbi:MAG: archaemetzincin family Zn-dependent metalloprotease [Chloroflexota bacterium]
MDQHNITLVSFAYFEEPFLKKIADLVRTETNHQVRVKEGHLDLSDFYDASRRQYNADKMLKAVDTIYGGDSFRTIGLFNVDLFIPILTYIFGQAYLNGRTSIASAFRLSNEGYGLQNDERMTLERLSKEVIHELGHTLGLIHCHNPMCVMRSGTYVEDIDQKNTGFCTNCKKRLPDHS